MASRGSERWMRDNWGAPCHPDLGTLPIYAGGPKLQLDKRVHPLFTLVGAVFLRYGYIIRRAGGYNCRRNTSNPKLYSNHAWALAGDFNDDTNPYRRDKLVTDMPLSMISEIRGIKNIDGLQAIRTGADWDGNPKTAQGSYDAMHFECILTPDELLRGFAVQSGQPTQPVTWPVIRKGATGPAVIELQWMLGMQGITGLGNFGPRTQIAVIMYQKSRGLVADGVVGHATWTALLTHMPPLAVGAVGPQKVIIK